MFNAWQSGREAWPGINIGYDDFVAYVDERWTGAARRKAHARASLMELYLACGCALGDTAALCRFEELFFCEIDEEAKRIEGSPPPEEARQILRIKLFVADPGQRPRIAEYSGRGALRTWVRMTAMRTLLALARREVRQVPIESAALTLLVGTGEDPELKYLKCLYSNEFRCAFEQAFLDLGYRDRNVLRFVFAEGLSVDAIGHLYRVHRATAARWVVKAHEKLAASVKRAMRHRLGVSENECSTILRLIESELDITLERYWTRRRDGAEKSAASPKTSDA
jgi:RNA polymerase sigma-70 factor (ECF subfamily)